MGREVLTGRGHMYTYGGYMLMYGRNRCSIIIILQFKIKDGKKMKKYIPVSALNINRIFP